MRNKLFALLATFLLLSNSLPVHAQELPISKTNQYICSVTGGGIYEYTVPFTGNFEITLAGAQGSPSGGYGYTIGKTVRLNKGDTIKFNIGSQPTSSTVSKAGGHSYFYINGNLEMKAGGGTGGYNYDMSDKRVTTSSKLVIDGYPSGWVTYHTHHETRPGDCYKYTKHSHTASCRYHECGDWMRDLGIEDDGDGRSTIKQECSGCGNTRTISTSGGADAFHYNNTCDQKIYECGNTPLNSNIQLKCGYTQGQQIDISPATPGSCSGSFASQSLSNVGNGKFIVKLAEQTSLVFHDNTAPHDNLFWNKINVDLLLKDDTVVYFRRR